MCNAPSETAIPKIEHKIIARLDAAHGVHDVNTVAWCPRAGMEGVFATAGDDGHVKVWKVESASD